jgi:hypothetical protein
MTLNKGFDAVEATMIKNIANSLFQIHFHERATLEEIDAYYGWDDSDEKKKKITEEERPGLIMDTLQRLKQEQAILEFYIKNKDIIKKLYGNKNPTGNLTELIQRTVSEYLSKRIISNNARGDDERGPEPSANNVAGQIDYDATTGNSIEETQGDERTTNDR